MLRLPATNKQRKKKKISPRTSPRILTEDAINLTPTNPSSSAEQKRDTSADKKRESEGREQDRCPVLASVSTVKSLGGTAPTVLSQLRKGCVEQTIKSFEKLQSGDWLPHTHTQSSHTIILTIVCTVPIRIPWFWFSLSSWYYVTITSNYLQSFVTHNFQFLNVCYTSYLWQVAIVGDFKWHAWIQCVASLNTRHRKTIPVYI